MIELRCKDCNSSSIEEIDGKFKCQTCGKEYKLVEASETSAKLLKNSTKVILAVLVISLVISLIIIKNTNSSLQNYQNAISLKNSQKYEEAKQIFVNLGDFLDSEAQIGICDKAIRNKASYDSALTLMNSKNYNAAKPIFEQLIKDNGIYEESKNKLEECNKAISIKEKYDNALIQLNNKNYQEAKVLFEELGDYEDSKNKLEECDKENYNKALAFMDSGNYKEAKEIFDYLGDFKDCKDKLEHFDENIYKEALNNKKQGLLVEAINKFKYLVSFKDSSNQMKICEEINLIKIAKIGEIVKFGNYEQDANETNGKEPIEWIVLDKDKNKAFLLSKKGLESKNYHDCTQITNWDDCALRKWLNEDFIYKAFNSKEKNNINETVLEQHKYKDDKDDSKKWLSQGSYTKDSIFLLSVKELSDYLVVSLKNEVTCYPTKYVNSRLSTKIRQTGSWRLRTKTGNYSNAVVSPDGTIKKFEVWYKDDGKNKGLIRPAMWVKLDFNE